jgi:beta-glucosidase
LRPPRAEETVTAAPLYRDPDATPAARAEDLVGRMTLDEKLAQLGCVWSTQLVEHDAFSEARALELLAHGTGHVTRIGAATGLRPRESAAFLNAIQRFLVERTRLGIPALVHEESCAGFTARDATQFPQAIGLAATFDPDAVLAMARVIRAQMLAVGARQTLAPVLDVARDPRWGRTEETFGEDPYLASRLGVAYVRGMQGDDLRSGVAATGKHFLAYGASEGGLNHAPAHVGPRELREVYARPFAAAIREAGLASVMNAYNEVDGLPCGGSPEILDDLLRGELGFAGVVVADYFAVRLLETFHRVAADRGEAAARALAAGIDVELPALDCYGAPLRAQVEAGRVPLARVDRAVRRALELKFALGLFEAPCVDAERAAEPYDTPASVALARELARRSIVLLRNEAGLLPLDPAASPLAVIGPAADDVRLLLGDYHYPAHLEIVYARAGAPGGIAPAPEAPAFRPGPYFRPMVSVLAGVRAALAPGTELRFARGCDVLDESREGFDAAVRAARGAAAAIVAVGGRSGLVPQCTSGEFRDASHLGLTGVQEELVEAVAATGTPTVVVLVNGRPLALARLAERVPALVEAWLPGEQGGHAVADVLFGRASPGGRLPISLPRSVGQVPVYHGHKSGGGRSQMFGDYSDGPARPLFAFGHGLSYTRFEYADLAIEPGTVTAFEPVAIAIRVTNAGERAGDEVVQLYARDLVASVTRPVRQLVGFQRLALAPGEARRVVFQLDPSQLAFVGPGLRWRVEPGRFAVQVGASSEDVRAEGSLEIVGGVRELDSSEIVPTRASLLPG